MTPPAVPARLDGQTFRVYCPGCATVHVHRATDCAPLCEAGSIGAWLGYELVLVDHLTDDRQLAALALEVWLLANDWRQCRGRDTWQHRTFGRASVALAAVRQAQLDAFNVHRLQHLRPIEC